MTQLESNILESRTPIRGTISLCIPSQEVSSGLSGR